MRARVEERTPFPWAVKEPLLKETNGLCAHCGVELDRYTNLSVDHFIPLNKGGSNDPDNLTVLCDDCNLEKSDMILPVSWYPHLGKKKKDIMIAGMRRYMKETDYLSVDNLVPMDTFRIEVPITIEKRNRTIRMPAYIQGIRMTRDDAFAWLMEYKRSLSYKDAQSTFTHPSQFEAPCFMLKKGDVEVAMVNPWLRREWDDEVKTYNNTVCVDWFFAPTLPKRDYLPEMLQYLAYGVEHYIAGAMSSGMDTACAVLFSHRCYASDAYCKPVFDHLASGRADSTEEAVARNSRQASQIRIITAFNIIGERKACEQLKKRMREENGDNLMSFHDVAKENEALNRRLEGESNGNKV